jgi:hypothetical protein
MLNLILLTAEYEKNHFLVVLYCFTEELYH